MKYIGYGGFGNQVRDVLHIYDFCDLIFLQIKKLIKLTIDCSLSVAQKSYTSLKELTKICEKINNNRVSFNKIKKTSIYDIPYFITNNKLVTKTYNWKPKRDILKVVTDTFLWLKNNKYKINKYF